MPSSSKRLGPVLSNRAIFTSWAAPKIWFSFGCFLSMDWRVFLRIPPSPVGRKDTLRLAAPVLIPLIGFSLIGSFTRGLLTALGAYIVLFGAEQPARRRLTTFVAASGLMLAAISCGLLVGHSFWLTTVAYLATAWLSVAGFVILNLGPPGPYFFVLMVGGGTLFAEAQMTLMDLLPYVALGNALATIFGMADLAFDRYRPVRDAIAAAEGAVTELHQSVEAAEASRFGADKRTPVDQTLRDAVSAIHKAWATLLDDNHDAENEDTRKLEAWLDKVHREYRRLYLATVENQLLLADGQAGGEGSAAYELANTAPKSVAGAQKAAFGTPSTRYRLAREFVWPLITLITLVRVTLALLLTSLVTHVSGDRHPFWAVLVVVLVLSFPGDQKLLRLRSLQRLIGTVIGIGLFVPTIWLWANGIVNVVVLCALFWGIVRLSKRNYLFGSVLITLFALILTVPLSPGETPGELALSRMFDTCVAVASAVAMIEAVGPRQTGALALRSAQQIAQEVIAVLDHIERGDDFLLPSFVEQRRRLQATLLHAGSARLVANNAEVKQAEPFLSLERNCARIGRRILAATWEMPSHGDDVLVTSLRSKLQK